jgi:hypothetical protein
LRAVRLLDVFLATVGFTVLCFLGAAAFNPDDGFVLQSESAWRVFGIGAYLGGAIAPLLAVAWLIQLALQLGRSAAHRIRG